MLHPSYKELINAVNNNAENEEDMLVQSRYSIVLATAKRARQLIKKAKNEEVVLRKKALSLAISEIYNSEVKIIAEDKIN